MKKHMILAVLIASALIGSGGDAFAGKTTNSFREFQKQITDAKNKAKKIKSKAQKHQIQQQDAKQVAALHKQIEKLNEDLAASLAKQKKAAGKKKGNKKALIALQKDYLAVLNQINSAKSDVQRASELSTALKQALEAKVKAEYNANVLTEANKINEQSAGDYAKKYAKESVGKQVIDAEKSELKKQADKYKSDYSDVDSRLRLKTTDHLSEQAKAISFQAALAAEQAKLKERSDLQELLHDAGSYKTVLTYMNGLESLLGFLNNLQTGAAEDANFIKNASKYVTKKRTYLNTIFANALVADNLDWAGNIGGLQFNDNDTKSRAYVQVANEAGLASNANAATRIWTGQLDAHFGHFADVFGGHLDWLGAKKKANAQNWDAAGRAGTGLANAHSITEIVDSFALSVMLAAYSTLQVAATGAANGSLVLANIHHIHNQTKKYFDNLHNVLTMIKYAQLVNTVPAAGGFGAVDAVELNELFDSNHDGVAANYQSMFKKASDAAIAEFTALTGYADLAASTATMVYTPPIVGGGNTADDTIGQVHAMAATAGAHNPVNKVGNIAALVTCPFDGVHMSVSQGADSALRQAVIQVRVARKNAALTAFDNYMKQMNKIVLGLLIKANAFGAVDTRLLHAADQKTKEIYLGRQTVAGLLEAMPFVFKSSLAELGFTGFGAAAIAAEKLAQGNNAQRGAVTWFDRHVLRDSMGNLKNEPDMPVPLKDVAAKTFAIGEELPANKVKGVTYKAGKYDFTPIKWN